MVGDDGAVLTAWRSRRRVEAQRRVLHALAEWRTGPQLVRRTQLRFGRLYRALFRLLKLGLVERRWRPGRVPQRQYRVTRGEQDDGRVRPVETRPIDWEVERVE